MHAYLITGNSTDERTKKVTEILEKHNVPPIRKLTTITDKASIGVEDVRDISHLAFRRASNTPQAILVEDAHKMTIVAQNAFLKTLEEPPKNTIIILSSVNEDALLETIRSRCIPLTTPTSQTSPTNLQEQEMLFEKLKNSGIGERIKFAEDTGKSREEAIEFVEGQLLLLHSLFPNLPNHPNFPKLKTDKSLLQTLSDLRGNVNPKMALFELLKAY